jgi:hypothetical protein
MWALLRKNFWMWRPSRSANCALFSFALAFSLLDARWRFSGIAWILPCYLVVLLGLAGASSAMNIDLKHDNILFLEYLPIRRWQIWLANSLDQLIACLLVIPLLCWCRVLTWTAADADLAPGEHGLFESRWLLPVALASGVFFVFSYSLYWRTFFKSDKATMVPSLLGTSIYIVLPFVIPAVLMLAPTFWDVLPLVLIQGTVFALGSFIAFSLPPAHWTNARRFVWLGIPLALAALCIEIGMELHACGRWQRLDWKEEGLSVFVQPTSGGSQWVIANVQSPRSGGHFFVYEPGHDRFTYVGRNLNFMTRQSVSRDNPLIAVPNEMPFEWWPFHFPIECILADGAGKSELFPRGVVTDNTGQQFRISEAYWLQNGKLLLLVGYGGTSYKQTALCMNKSGGIARTFDAMNGCLTSQTEILTATSLGNQSTDAAENQFEYRLYDTVSSQESRFQLPGRVLCFSDDLGEAACLCTNTRNNLAYDSVVLVRIPTGEKRTVLEEGILPPIPQRDFQQRPGYFDPLAARSNFVSFYLSNGPTIIFDRQFQKAVALVLRYDQAVVHPSLEFIDLVGGTHRTLVPEKDLPVRSLSTTDFGLNLFGFTSDGRNFTYMSFDQLTRVRVADGHANATKLQGANPIPELSASGNRAICCGINPARGRNSQTINYVVLDMRTSRVLCKIADASSLQWLDEDHVAVARKEKLFIADIATQAERQLLPLNPL